MIIDAHAHVFTRADRSRRETSALAPLERTATVTDFLAASEPAGVTRALLVPLDAADDYAPAAALADPRFGLVAIAGDRTGGEAWASIDALRVQWVGKPGQRVTDSPRFALFENAARHGVPIWTYLFPGQMPLLGELAKALPDLRIVLNHLGFSPRAMTIDEYRRPAFADPLPPQTQAAVRGFATLPNVYVLFSGHYALAADAYPYESLRPFSTVVADYFGADRMIWGSDYPWIREVPGYRQTLDLVRLQLPDASESELARVRGGTAARLFPRLKGVT